MELQWSTDRSSRVPHPPQVAIGSSTWCWMGHKGEEVTDMKNERLQIFSGHSLEADLGDMLEAAGGAHRAGAR